VRGREGEKTERERGQWKESDGGGGWERVCERRGPPKHRDKRQFVIIIGNKVKKGKRRFLKFACTCLKNYL